MSDNAEVTFEPGELIIRSGSSCDALYIIKEGQLEVYKEKDGKRIPIGLIGSGQYVGARPSPRVTRF